MLATSYCRVPNDELVGELLSVVLRRDVSCVWTPGTHQLPEVGKAAVYRDDAGTAAAVAVADQGFICRTGGALVLLPRSGVDEAVDTGEIADLLIDTFAEVARIMARLLNSDATPDVRLSEIHDLPGPSPDRRAAEIMQAPSRRRVFDIHVRGYGRGRVIFLFA